MKIKRFTKEEGGYHGELGFYCPGCKQIHFLNDNETNAECVNRWDFNKDYERPTINPSYLTYYPDQTYRCHSFIRDGKIQFLPDCTHELAGKTVELPNLKEHEMDTH